MVWDRFRRDRGAPTLSLMTVRRSVRARVATLGAAAAFLAVTAGPAPAAIPPPPGGPILVVTSGGSDFGRYLPEILRAEGLN